MVMTKPPADPIRMADMGRQEAQQVTQAIKDNFDSLGSMLIQARDRKAYRALGYRSFQAYCQTEFGKSVSGAYQLIEDAKIISKLEERIKDNHGEDIILNFPSSHLQPLKQIADVDDQLKAIQYAQNLAKVEGKKPTKKHLELAVYQVNGHRSEDFRKAIHDLGFTEGTQVETTSPLKRDRGIVRRLDKSGKIYVELYNYPGAKSMPFDPTELRVLTDKEKPTNPLDSSIASKGDRVLIFASGLQGRVGTIFSYSESKQTLVRVDGESAPVTIAYAEMELVKPEKKDSNWETDLSWNTAQQTYYYFQKEDRIYSDKWPVGLTLTPSSHKLSPIEFMANWEEQSAEQLQQLFSGASSPEPLNQKSLGISFAQTIDELISGKKTQTRRAWQDDYAKNFIRYFDENILIPALDKGRHRGGHELGFIKLTQRPYQQYLSEMTATDLQGEGGMVATAQEFIDTFFEGQNKLVWVLHFEFLPLRSDAEILQENQRLRQQLLEAETAIQSMITASKASSSTDIAAHSDFLVENTSEISAPGDTAAHSDFLVENTSEISAPGDTAAHSDFFLVENTFEISAPGDDDIAIEEELPAKISSQIPSIRNKFLDLIEKYEKSKRLVAKQKEIEYLNKNIRVVQERLKSLEKFEQMRIGHTICHQRQPMILGKITGLDFSQGEMPIVWVKYFIRGELEQTPTSEIVSLISIVNT
jgi:hypothetical protein